MTRRVLTLVLAAVAAFGALGGLSAGQAHASALSPGARMLAWAQAHETGHWYAWGGTGLSAYDCSGAVFRAAEEIGIGSMPRTTFGMLASRMLVRTYHPVAGDLAFYGTGHVEIVAHGHNVTFGALQTGTRVGYHHWGGWWRPSMYFEIR